MKNKKKYLYWGLVLLFIAILAIPKISFESKEAAAQNFGNSAVEAEVMIVEEGNLAEKIYLNASLMGDEEIELRPEVAGKVIKINFDEGDNVNKDDLLVKINDAELQAQLKRVESQLKLAEDREYRSKQLLDQELISQEEYDIIQNDLSTRKAEKELLEAQIEKTEIRAPFDGVVGLRWVSEGGFINSSVVVATLTKTNPVKIDFAVPIKHAAKIKTGEKIKLTVPNSSEEYSANIYAVDPKIDQATRTLKVRAKADNSSGKLLPGSYAEIELVLNENSSAVTVPTQAVVPDISGEIVFLFKNGKAVPSPIQIGLRTNTEVQIIDGVNPGDTVITSAIIQLRPGVDVSIRNFR